MSTISSQQSPIQASINQGPSLPALPIQQVQQQSPVQVSPVDQLELAQAPTTTPSNINAAAQTSATEALAPTTCQPSALEPTTEPVSEPEKKPWYAGIVSFFESLIAGVKAIFNAVAPIFQFIAPFLGPIGGFLSGMVNGSSSRPSSPEVSVRPAPSTFEERGTNSVRANAPLGIATGPVIEAPRASITSG